jgi:hypothetical protein
LRGLLKPATMSTLGRIFSKVWTRVERKLALQTQGGCD